MKNSLPKVTNITNQNRLPDCLVMEIYLQPVNENNWNPLKTLAGKIDNLKMVNLKLSIQFNEQREALLGGDIFFGLRSGELSFEIENGTMPLTERELVKPLNTSFKKALSIKTSNTKKNVLGGAIARASKDNGLNPKIEASKETEESIDITEEFEEHIGQISTKGDLIPTWVFESRTREITLKGILKNVSLGRIKVDKYPCKVKAKFSVDLKDVIITKENGIWGKNIDKAKRVTLDRWLAKKILEKKLKPYLSLVELVYEC